MRRRDALRMGALFCFAPILARAQARKRVVVIPAGTEMTERSRPLVASWFAEDGFVEGRDIVLEFVALDTIADPAELEHRARALVATQPAAILVSPMVDAALFKRITRDVPIVFWALPGDPVRMGLVESFPRPGANFTGTADPGYELMAKSCELFKALRPGLKRVGTLMDEGTPEGERAIMRDVQGAAAKRLGLERVEIVIPVKAAAAQVERAIRAAKPDALDVVLSGGSVWMNDAMKFVERSGILAAWDGFGQVKAGGLLAVHSNGRELEREAVRIAAQILRGTKPAEIPVYQGRIVAVSINLSTARAMGLTVPDSVLIQATNVLR